MNMGEKDTIQSTPIYAAVHQCHPSPQLLLFKDQQTGHAATCSLGEQAGRGGSWSGSSHSPPPPTQEALVVAGNPWPFRLPIPLTRGKDPFKTQVKPSSVRLHSRILMKFLSVIYLNSSPSQSAWCLTLSAQVCPPLA